MDQFTATTNSAASTFDNILASVQAGIDAFRRGGDVGGAQSGQQTGTTVQTAGSSGGGDLVFLILIGAVIYLAING